MKFFQTCKNNFSIVALFDKSSPIKVIFLNAIPNKISLAQEYKVTLVPPKTVPALDYIKHNHIYNTTNTLCNSYIRTYYTKHLFHSLYIQKKKKQINNNVTISFNNIC
jgi:hypothetical protein